MFHIRLMAAGVIALGGAVDARAQGCDSPGGCGRSPLFDTGILSNLNKHLARDPNANYPHCSTKAFAISNRKQCGNSCGPTLNPDSCSGYYPTKWRRWEEICPQGDAGVISNVPQVIRPLPPGIPTTPKAMPLPQPTPLTPKEKDPIPEPTVVIPAPLPMSAVNVTAIPTEHGKPASISPVPPLKTLPNVVVPPVRALPERSRN